MKRLVLIVPALLVVAAAALALPGFSSATFTSRSLPSLGTVSAAADWTPPTVAVQSPADFVSGVVTVTATAADADSGIKDVAIAGRIAGSGAWTTICTDTTAPYSCTVDTAGVANGAYELRAVATDTAGNSATSSIVGTSVDNQAPQVAMTDPGSPIRATRTFAATASDAHSGIANVVIQASANATDWITICTTTTSPYSCGYDTKNLADDTYAFRAVATDRAGNSTTSAAVGDRVVDNSVATVTMTDPGAYLFATVNLAAAATSTNGVQSVALQRSVAGADNWTTVCTDTTSPYTCSWATTGLDDGLWDLRAVLTDTKGKVTTSEVVANRRVDNAAPQAVDIQAVNGGTAGRFDAGDVITLTYSSQVSPNSISAGWDGSAPLPIRLNLQYRFLASDILTFTRTDGGAVNLGSVNLGGGFTGFASNSVLNGTMVASTTTVDGISHTTITITVGDLVSGYMGSHHLPATLTWTPSPTATGLNGVPVVATEVRESGPWDRDF